MATTAGNGTTVRCKVQVSDRLVVHGAVKTVIYLFITLLVKLQNGELEIELPEQLVWFQILAPNSGKSTSLVALS